jgi:hypothetical protein
MLLWSIYWLRLRIFAVWPGWEFLYDSNVRCGHMTSLFIFISLCDFILELDLDLRLRRMLETIIQRLIEDGRICWSVLTISSEGHK